MAVVVFMAGARATREKATPALMATVIAGMLHSFSAVYEVTSNSETWRSGGGFFNPNHLAAVLVLLATYCLIEVTRPGRDYLPYGHFGLWCAVAVLIAGLFATGSRAGALAMIMASAALVVLRRPRLWLPMSVGVVGFVGAIIGLRSRVVDAYSFSRLQIWRETLTAVWENPLGYGFGTFAQTMRDRGIEFPGMVRHPRLPDTAHSEIVQLLFELGIPGGLLLLWLGVTMAKWCWRSFGQARNDSEQLALVAAKVAVWVAVVTPALFADTLRVPIVALSAALLAGALAQKSGYTDAMITTASTRPVELRALALVCGLLAVGMVIPAALSRTCMETAAEIRRTGDLNTALSWSGRARALASWSVAAHLQHESIIHALNGNDREAMRRLLELADAHPRDCRVVRRASRLARAAVPERVLPLLKRIADCDKRNAMSRFELAMEQHKHGDILGARRSLHQTLELEPNCARALLLLATLTPQDDWHRRQELVSLSLKANDAAKEFDGYASAVLSLSPQELTVALAFKPGGVKAQR